MRNIYIAWDKFLNRKVIVKEFFIRARLILTDFSMEEQLFTQPEKDRMQKEYDNLLKEARAIAKIGGGSAIVHICDCFLLNGKLYLVTNFMEGMDLGELISKRGKLTFEQCVCLFRPLMEELVKIHGQQIVHGNIAPHNIMLQRDGSLTLRILGAENDVRNVAGDIVFGGQTHSIFDAYDFLKCASGAKRIGPWLDVFGLCATIYYCITGEKISYFKELDEELCFPPETNGNISDEGKQILRDGLTGNSDKCIQSVDEMLWRMDLSEAGTAAKSGNKREIYKKICINCMNLMWKTENICSVCGFDMDTQQFLYMLPCNFLLHSRYVIDRFSEHNGFGITYAAWDRLLNRKVIVKEYFPNGEVRRNVRKSISLSWNSVQSESVLWQKGYDNFLKEARKIAKMDQIPSIVHVRDIFFENKTAYIVSDFVEGITLKKMLLVNGTLTFEACIRLLRPVMEGLAKVHSQKIVHTAIDPDNIIVQTDGKAMLLNLGLAKDMMDIKEQKSQLAVKKGFSPLEEYMEKKKLGPWTDVYGMCATIYYCITGKVLPSALERVEDEILRFPKKMNKDEFYSVMQTLKDGLAVKTQERIRNMEELLQRLDKKEVQDKKEMFDPLADTAEIEPVLFDFF